MSQAIALENGHGRSSSSDPPDDGPGVMTARQVADALVEQKREHLAAYGALASSIQGNTEGIRSLEKKVDLLTVGLRRTNEDLGVVDSNVRAIGAQLGVTMRVAADRASKHDDELEQAREEARAARELALRSDKKSDRAISLAAKAAALAALKWSAFGAGAVGVLKLVLWAQQHGLLP